MESAIYIIIGSFIGAFSSIIITIISKRSEERKHHKELIINAATEQWKQISKTSIAIKKITGQALQIEPLDATIVYLIKFTELMFKRNLTPARVEKYLSKVDKVHAKILDIRRKQQELSTT